MRRLRIGLALGHESARAVLVERGVAIGASEVPREPSHTVLDTLGSLLEGLGLGGGHRHEVSVSLGATLSRAKCVSGLPTVGDPELMAAVIAEGRGTFFLGDPSRFVTTGVRLDGPSAAWAGALDRSVVNQVRDACQALGLNLVAMAPVAAVLPLAMRTQSISWADGPIHLDIEMDGDHWRTVRAHLSEVNPGRSRAEPPPELTPFGEDCVRFADALGASRLTGAEPLCVGGDGLPFRASNAARRRMVLPIALSAVAFVALLLSPLHSEIAARRAEAEVRTIEASSKWGMAEEVYEQLSLATSILREVQDFESNRLLRGPALATIAAGLPPGAVVHTIDISDARAEVSAFTVDNAAGLARSLRGMPGIGQVEIVGPSRREALGGTEMEAVRLGLDLVEAGAFRKGPRQ